MFNRLNLEYIYIYKEEVIIKVIINVAISLLMRNYQFFRMIHKRDNYKNKKYLKNKFMFL